MTDYQNFVFYGSWRETLEGIEAQFGQEYAREILWNIMTCGTSDEIKTEDKFIGSFVRGMCQPTILAARGRYERAVLSGSRGGRPTSLSEEDQKTIAALRKEGLTAKQIGEKLGVSDRTIRRSNGWNYSLKEDKTGQKVDKGQNLDIYKYIYIDNDKDNDNLSMSKIYDIYPNYESYPELNADLGFPDKGGWLDGGDPRWEDENPTYFDRALAAAKLGYHLPRI